MRAYKVYIGADHSIEYHTDEYETREEALKELEKEQRHCMRMGVEFEWMLEGELICSDGWVDSMEYNFNKIEE